SAPPSVSAGRAVEGRRRLQVGDDALGIAGGVPARASRNPPVATRRRWRRGAHRPRLRRAAVGQRGVRPREAQAECRRDVRLAVGAEPRRRTVRGSDHRHVSPAPDLRAWLSRQVLGSRHEAEGRSEGARRQGLRGCRISRVLTVLYVVGVLVRILGGLRRIEKSGYVELRRRLRVRRQQEVDVELLREAGTPRLAKLRRPCRPVALAGRAGHRVELPVEDRQLMGGRAIIASAPEPKAQRQLNDVDVRFGADEANGCGPTPRQLDDRLGRAAEVRPHERPAQAPALLRVDVTRHDDATLHGHRLGPGLALVPSDGRLDPAPAPELRIGVRALLTIFFAVALRIFGAYPAGWASGLVTAASVGTAIGVASVAGGRSALFAYAGWIVVERFVTLTFQLRFCATVFPAPSSCSFFGTLTTLFPYVLGGLLCYGLIRWLRVVDGEPNHLLEIAGALALPEALAFTFFRVLFG